MRRNNNQRHTIFSAAAPAEGYANLRARTFPSLVRLLTLSAKIQQLRPR